MDAPAPSPVAAPTPGTYPTPGSSPSPGPTALRVSGLLKTVNPTEEAILVLREAREALRTGSREERGQVLDRLAWLLTNPKYHPHVLSSGVPIEAINVLMSAGEDLRSNRAMAGRVVGAMAKTNTTAMVQDLVSHGGGREGLSERCGAVVGSAPKLRVLKQAKKSWPERSPFSFGPRAPFVEFFDGALAKYTVAPNVDAYVDVSLWEKFGTRPPPTDSSSDAVTVLGACMYMQYMVEGVSMEYETALLCDVDLIWELSRVAELAGDGPMVVYCDSLVFRLGREHSQGFVAYAEMFAACAAADHPMLWCMAYAHYTHAIDQSEEARLAYEAALDAVPRAREGILRHSFYSSF